jgi:hypothetical protein
VTRYVVLVSGDGGPEAAQEEPKVVGWDGVAYCTRFVTVRAHAPVVVAVGLVVAGLLLLLTIAAVELEVVALS